MGLLTLSGIMLMNRLGLSLGNHVTQAFPSVDPRRLSFKPDTMALYLSFCKCAQILASTSIYRNSPNLGHETAKRLYAIVCLSVLTNRVTDYTILMRFFV